MSHETYTLLVVDDNEDNRYTLTARLKRQGYTEVTTAANGQQALDLLRARPFDLLLLDIMMPELNGYQVLEQLKADDTLRHIPVIMISAVDELESVIRCIELGAEDYLPKPFNATLLKARIGACLEKKRLRDKELLYLRDVAHVTAAAASMEAGQFQGDMLVDVTKRTDELGQLARVFERMVREFLAREQRLTEQVQALRIEIDEGKKARHVSEITETEYFQDLQKKAKDLRHRPTT